jgi:NADH:ubiquinone oxidoreductase subunit 5 (subunit L)/multisubunit Na+/H+ antiporter MnhA subunit
LTLDFNINIFNLIFSIVVFLIRIGVVFYNKIYFSFLVSLKYKINLIIFILSIIILINRRNLISLLIGWDGLGISSFFLVSFYSNLNSRISSLVTFFFNRLGDGFIIIFLSINLIIFIKIDIINLNLFIFILFLIGLFTKSSQIPFGV